jgi:hypothetical protein
LRAVQPSPLPAWAAPVGRPGFFAQFALTPERFCVTDTRGTSTSSEKPVRLTPSSAVVLKFTWHVIVAVAGFLVIFSAAITLNLFIAFALIAIDVAGFAYFIWVEFVNLLVSIRALRRLAAT